MRWSANKAVLGLSLEPRAIHAAEWRGGRVARSARLDLPAEVTWEDSVKLGETLRRFLTANGLTAKTAVAGLAGRWLLTRSQALPPMEPAKAANVLRLAIEREFPADAKQWVFDAAGQPSAATPTTLLLCATPADRLRQVVDGLSRAGLDVRAVTVTAMSLAMVYGKPGASHNVLHVTDDGAELAVVDSGRVTMLERLSLAAGAGGAALATELRRLAAMASMRTERVPAAMTVVDDSTSASVSGADLGSALGIPVQIVSGETAAALARTGDAPVVDFLHSRLAIAPPRRWTGQRTAGAILAGALLVAMAWLVLDWRSQQTAVNDLAASLADMREPLTAAKANVDRAATAERWFDDRPAMIECLRAVSLAFPETGPVRATSLALREDLTGTLAGKAPDEESALAMVDRMKSSKQFGEVKTLYLRREDNKSRTVAFALTFAFSAEK